MRIAMAHVKSGPIARGTVPRFRDGYATCLIGVFIPVSSYYAIDRIESLTTYELRDAGLFDEGEMRFLSEIDKIQIKTESTWLARHRKKINDLEHE